MQHRVATQQGRRHQLPAVAGVDDQVRRQAGDQREQLWIVESLGRAHLLGPVQGRQAGVEVLAQVRAEQLCERLYLQLAGGL